MKNNFSRGLPGEGNILMFDNGGMQAMAINPLAQH